MFEVLAAVNVGIAAAYLVIGGVIIPQLRLRRWAGLFAIGFFVTCALTHFDVAFHAVTEHTHWMIEPHMWAIHVAQLVVDWGFIIAMAPWRGPARSALARQIETFLATSGAALTREERQLVEAVVRSGTAHDVTLEEIHRAIETMAEQKKVEQNKNEFVAYASHELRTPAAVLYGVAKTLDERGEQLDPAKQRELVTALVEHGERLKRLIDQLLDLSRYDNGTLSVDLSPIRLRETVEKFLADPGIDVAIPPDVVVEADEQALERVVGNLVENARRYGQHPITVSAERDNGRVIVSVEDRGSGIPEAFVPTMFSRFTRASATTHPGGAGLGLAIAAGYARAQGTELRYVPAKPHGARFEFVLNTPNGS